MKTPDFTPQAIGAFVILFLTNLLLLFGIDVAPAKEAALEVLLNGVVIVAFLVHDALIRRARANLAAVKAGVLPESMQ